jgi:hypothetical protein
MGFFETLFGRQKPVPVGPERLFAMSTAQITLEAEQHLTPAGAVAICFKRIASGPFHDLESDLRQLLELAAKDAQLQLATFEDPLGYQWFILKGTDFQALVTALHVASQTLIEKGYGSQLLFAIFAFTDADGKPVYWIYNYKRGTFYPFVPRPDSHSSRRQRDNQEEMRLSAALGKELPVEGQLEFWYPVWDLPL